MNKFKKGDIVICINSFSGLNHDFKILHNNPIKKDEVFKVVDSVIESIGEFLILEELTNTQQNRVVNDLWLSKKFKHKQEVFKNKKQIKHQNNY